TEDRGHTPARDRGTELAPPPLRKSDQEYTPPDHPRRSLAPEAARETLPYAHVDARYVRAHAPTVGQTSVSYGDARDRSVMGRVYLPRHGCEAAGLIGVASSRLSAGDQRRRRVVRRVSPV